MKADIVATPRLSDFRVTIQRPGIRQRHYRLAKLTDASALRLCTILNKLHPVVEWDGDNPTIYYFASQQEENR